MTFFLGVLSQSAVSACFIVSNVPVFRAYVHSSVPFFLSSVAWFTINKVVTLDQAVKGKVAIFLTFQSRQA
jgi:hypothetical protein